MTSHKDLKPEDYTDRKGEKQISEEFFNKKGKIVLQENKNIVE